jgi:hypothetical protein
MDFWRSRTTSPVCSTSPSLIGRTAPSLVVMTAPKVAAGLDSATAPEVDGTPAGPAKEERLWECLCCGLS